MSIQGWFTGLTLGLIYFRIDWFDLQGSLKSLLQHYSLKASILFVNKFVCIFFLIYSTYKRYHMIFVCLIFSDLFKFSSLLIAGYVPGTVLGTGDIVMEKTDMVPALLRERQ